MTQPLAFKRVLLKMSGEMLAGEGDQVVHGQEIGLVIELGDQRELVLDQLADFRGYRLRPAAMRALQGQLAQPVGRVPTLRHQLGRVLVAQLVQ